MKKGDVVVCVDNRKAEFFFVIGKEYEVLDSNDVSIVVKNDVEPDTLLNRRTPGCEWRFKEIEEWKNIKRTELIDKILKWEYEISICKKDCREGRYKGGEKYEVNEFDDINFIKPDRGGYSIFIWEYEKFFYTYEEILNKKRTDLIDKILNNVVENS